ncbi:hypothetical protein KXD40_008295 [Peronospora effusa]|uniref:RxLR effector protein n=1 Tax=Peronospora effusa TaxID=542832 RepID=A0A3M6VN22_9STRA|nr:hypothetical protein DD238_008398 [Peronospora effusa]RQM08974.1 hypothetical protein DD237_008575 [Peronospora effusa]UIZ24251.1 hypothetical protein KXD40_008295 [Peronospora effusa]
MKLLHGLVMTGVVLLCENPATGATRSLRQNTSGKNLITMIPALETEPKGDRDGDSCKLLESLTSTPGIRATINVPTPLKYYPPQQPIPPESLPYPLRPTEWLFEIVRSIILAMTLSTGRVV